MDNPLTGFILSLGRIAEELRTIRKLYEAELATREKPVYLVTEKPSRKDTTVFMPGMEDEQPAFKRWLGIDDVEDDADADEKEE